MLRWLSGRTGWLTKQAGTSRWADGKVSVSGGIGYFLAFLMVSLVYSFESFSSWGILLGASLVFLLGILDDLITLRPTAKLFGQFLGAAVFVVFGNSTAFFSSDIANVLISMIWLVAMSNALNLLDNMDGLSSTTTLIASLFLGFFFYTSGNADLLIISLAIAGAALGFLFFNFPPASIYMGDSGALFLGMTLGGLAISRDPQASNILGIFGVPVLILLLPVLDTSMVTITRLLRGQSPAVGGKDHMSHRLVSLGLSERSVILLLGTISILGGLLAVLLEEISYTTSLVAIPISILILALFTAFLGHIRLEKELSPEKNLSVIKTITQISGRFHLAEMILDFFLISLSYYLAFGLRFGFPLAQGHVNLLIQSMPLIIVSGLVTFLMFRIYRGIWRFLSLPDVVRLGQAAVTSSVLAAFLILLVYRFDGFSRQVFLLYPIILFLMISASRISFRIFGTLFASRWVKGGVPIIVYGAGDGGEFSLREIERNNELNYSVIGFLDDNPLLHDKEIRGVRVLGKIDDLPFLLRSHQIEGLVISSRKIDFSQIKGLNELRSSYPNFWVKRLRIEFEDVVDADER